MTVTKSRVNQMEKDRITVMLTINKLIIGGAEQQFLELVKGLDKDRFNTIVVTLYPGGELEEEVKKIPGMEYICLNRKGKYNFFTLFTILRLLRQKRVDIVQPFLTPATFFTLLPAVIKRTPVKIITERGNLRRNPGRGYNLYLRLEDCLTRFADVVIPNSQSGKDYLITRGIKPEKIRVIYNGINTRRLTPAPAAIARIKDTLGLADDGPVVGISASLFSLKDHATFLRAAQIISGTMPQVKYIVLGDGPLRPDLEQMARELGIASRVLFVGNQSEVGPYLYAFDISCLCSKEPEGCSNSILEAMALGKPVVATEVGGNIELVEDSQTGRLVPIQNPQALADAILSLLGNPEQAREMGQRGKEKIAREFSLERMVRDYETIYKEMVTAKRDRPKPLSNEV
jgi:glycosyltransferase involved in cell wall biosynthesis